MRKGARTRLLRPVARAADGLVHNRQRRKVIQRYRRVACVALVEREDRGAGATSHD